MLKVYTSAVRSVIEYAVPVWQSIPGYLSDKIESIQKRALKIIFPCADSYSEALELARVETLAYRRDKIWFLAPGIPSEKDLISQYCELRGLGDILPQHWNFYIALSFFRVAAIAQGIYARAIHGNASAKNASLFGNLVEPLACAGLKVALQAHKQKMPMENMSSIFQPSVKAQRLYKKMNAFMEKYVYPAEECPPLLKLQNDYVLVCDIILSLKLLRRLLTKKWTEIVVLEYF
ncbi:Acyl-CoA dehydrogenase family member 11 [Stylophora pistillata]|uniref:Acyl-CoA dehydrogenase family member 11 n=1 Tax=Stylophora pistillata TaxID=50429 RepID=A0A2B4S588_STYPI|nr:Acyl-CoA dehydrogenase family member 11 [Stylophora pistillata]